METHRKHVQRGTLPAILLIILFLFVALFTIHTLLVRAPEVPDDTDASVDLPADSQTSAQESEEPLDVRKQYFYTLLLAGRDNGNGGTDTIILAAFDGSGKRCTCISIPRDTRVEINGKSHKINAAYNIGGMPQLAESVSDLLGIPVDFTVLVDLQGFAALVNAIDGVDFNVPIDMDYDDPYQDLSIHFSKGMQHLNGEDALKVVRFRHNNDGTGYGSEDIGRMATQQAFLKAVAKKMLRPENLGKVGEYANIFQHYVDTNLKASDIAWFGEQAIAMGLDNIHFSTIPSEWISPYMYLFPEETLTLVNESLNPYESDRDIEDLHIPQP